ncbi:SCO6880 family protein [Nocardia takedensis]|uniref:SCO6880 family protein n=1 Tax=Nocardia takedensis TaxID=259390 RepID=UPI003F7740FD
MADSRAEARRTYSAGREVRRVYAFGLPKRVFYILFASVLVGVLVALAGFMWIGLGWVAVSLLAAVPLSVRVLGKTGYELALLELAWRRQRRSGRNTLRAGPLSHAPGGRTRLPGVGAGTEMWWGTDKHGYRFGLIRMHSTNQYTAVLRCSPQGTAGMEQSTINQLVAEWGQFLAICGETGDIAGITVVAETIPETGARLRAEMARVEHPQASDTAKTWLREAGAGRAADRSGSQQHMRLAVTWTARTTAKKRDPMVMIADLAERLPLLCKALSRCQVVAQPMSDYQLAATVRRSFDPRPEVETAVEELMRRRFPGTPPAGETVDWLDAGPIAADTPDRTTYCHEGAYSRTWVMGAPPQGFHDESVLSPLLVGRADLPRKRVTLLYRPLAPGEASASVHADELSSRARISTTRGLSSARAVQDLANTRQAREEEARGAGVTDQALLITVTAESQEQLDGFGDITRDMASAARRLAIRPVFVGQDAAFLAGLGVGVLLPDHATVDKTLQGRE